MLGAIIGDIVGSVYESNNIKTKDFPLFSPGCSFTGGTVMTIAVAEALIGWGPGRTKAEVEANKWTSLETTSKRYIEVMKKYGELYPDAGYGGGFRKWLNSKDAEPYCSFGNGAAARVSPVGWFKKSWKEETLELTEKEAELCAAITHNHPEGIKGAQAVAGAVFLARSGKSKAEIREYIENRYGYDLSRTLDEIRPNYKFDATCQGTVPEAIIAWLESTGFEDAIRNAVSLGGDSNTLAAITGSIAEAEYGIPETIAIQALSILDRKLLSVHALWVNECFGSCTYFSRPVYELLFPYIDYFDKCPKMEVYDEPWGCALYGEAEDFVTAFYSYGRAVDYTGIIERYDGFDKNHRELLSSANLELLWAVLTAHIRSGRINASSFQGAVEEGHMGYLLKRMRELHERGERWQPKYQDEEELPRAEEKADLPPKQPLRKPRMPRKPTRPPKPPRR